METATPHSYRVITTAVLLSAIYFSSFSFAAKPERLENNHGYLVSLEKRNQSSTQNVGKALGLQKENRVEKIQSNQGKNGNLHTRYQQTYKGIPVWGKQIVVHRDQNGKIKRINGTLVKDIADDISNVSPSLKAGEAKSKVQKQFVIDGYQIEDQKQALTIYVDNDNVAHLAYEVRFLLTRKAHTSQHDRPF